MTSSLKQLVTARWFPTVTKSVVSGLVASGVLYALHALGITSVLPEDVNAAVTPFVGLLVTAMVQRGDAPGSADKPVGTVKLQATVATHTTDYKPEPTLGKTVAMTLLDSIAQEIDQDPSLLQGVAAQALGRVLSPQQVQIVTHEIVATGNEALHPN